MVHKMTLSSIALRRAQVYYSSMNCGVARKGRPRRLDGVLCGEGTRSNSQITISGMRS
jgi:hypothetical protein